MLLVLLAQFEAPSSLDTFIAKLIDGLALGAIYALLALGFVIIFKATQVLNFAHGAISAVGAYLVGYTATVQNIPGRCFPDLHPGIQFSISVIIGMILAALVGMAIERVFIRPMMPHFAVA